MRAPKAILVIEVVLWRDFCSSQHLWRWGVLELSQGSVTVALPLPLMFLLSPALNRERAPHCSADHRTADIRCSQLSGVSRYRFRHPS
jgi:hypothetical protein